ncbi:MAG TPA: hypothetical protein VMF69_20800 [Gemmataceae bacterium]|nr:hypothetical protein [Gemmataceae bacterium]
MAGTARVMLILLLGGTLSASGTWAQTTDGPAADSAAEAVPDFMTTFPRPPDQPTSLLAPAPPLGPPPPDMDQPYFQVDPLLDPPALGNIGWFGNVDMGILKPHLINELSLPVPVPVSATPGIPSSSSVKVGVDASHLNWTVSPRFELGYQLPSGFGAVSLAYRFLTAEGSDAVIGADGPATLTSRLNINSGDLSWSSREYTPWGPRWDLKFRVGVRYVDVYFDSRANASFAEAAAGSTIYFQRTTNSFMGIGAAGAVQLERQLGFWGLSTSALIDFAEPLGRVRQGYFYSSTTSADGRPQSANTFISSSMTAPILTTQLGLGWQPPAYPNFRMFAGWQFEYWWDVGRLLPYSELGYFFINGVALRGEWNF